MATQSETETTRPAKSTQYFEKGVDHHAAGRLEDAVSSYRAALLGNTDDPDILTNLGIALCELGNPDEGLAKLRQALRKQPDDPDILANLGNALFEDGRLSESLETLNHAIQISPEDADLHVLLGRVYFADGNADEARTQLRAAAAIDPNNEDLHAAIAEMSAPSAPAEPEAPAPATEPAHPPDPAYPTNGAYANGNGNGNGHASADPIAGQPVEAPPYDARDGGSRNGAVMETPSGGTAHVEPAYDADDDSYAALMAGELAGADAAYAGGVPTAPDRLPAGFGFHHPHSIKELYGNNKMFYWCIVVVSILFVIAFVYLWFTGQLKGFMPEVRIPLHFEHKTTPPKKLPTPPPGRQTPHPTHSNAPVHPQTVPVRSRSIAKITPNAVSTLPEEPDTTPVGPDVSHDGIDTRDIMALTGSTPDGQAGNGIPAGFANGKIGGRVYFIRLKHDSGAWDAYSDGTKNLLTFAKKYFPCESENRAYTATEIRDSYMDKGANPSFLYIYCDDTFALTRDEVDILRKYVDTGGFLFLDSRPDPGVRDVVKAQMARVMPGSSLSPIPPRDVINAFEFRLANPGIGENFMPSGSKCNYGVRGPNGKYVAFYTMGNFAHIFSSAQPDSDPYILAQYQMAINVVSYAVNKGDNSQIDTKAGASAQVTTAALTALGFLSGSPTAALKPGESVKVNPHGKVGDEPGEIKVIDPNE